MDVYDQQIQVDSDAPLLQGPLMSICYLPIQQVELVQWFSISQ